MKRTSFALLPALLCLVSTAYAQTASVTASDDSFEDRVELSWSASIPSGQFFRIERDGEVLAIRARTDQSFADLSGTPGTTYNYCVIPTDAQSNDGTPFCDTGRRIIFAPTNVSATDRTLEDRVTLSWSDRSDIEVGYRVYRTTVAASDSTLLATLAASRVTYNDASAVVGTTYRYCVVAFDNNGAKSAVSCDEGTRGAVMPPAAVAATDGQFNDRVRVTWVDQTSEETGYTIFRDGAEIGSVGVDITLFDDLAAVSGTDYNYCVSSTIGGIESVAVCDSGRRGDLTAPDAVVATDNKFDDRVDLAWQDVANTEDGFLVTRYRDAVVDSVFAPLGRDSESFSDASAEQAVTYSYCVQSFSDAGAPSRSLSAAVCDDGTRSAVLAPTAVAASDRSFEDRSEITWSNPSTTAMLFNVYRDGVLVDNIPGNETLYGDSQIASGIEYNYCVSAMTVTGANPSVRAEVAELVRSMRLAAVATDDADGSVAEVAQNPTAVLRAVQRLVQPNLSVSMQTSVQTSAQAAMAITESAQVCDTGSRLLKPPTSVAATFEEFEDHVEISWTDNSSVERGHRIYRKDEDDAEPVLVGTANAGRESFGDYRGIPGVTYTYSVRSFDLRGPGGESTADSDTGGRKIEAPTGFQATVGGSETELSLSWKDNSAAETAYEIKRDGTVIATTAPSAVTFLDTTPVPGVQHLYELTAIDSLGRSESTSQETGTAILAPGSFNASDTYRDRIVLAWENETVVGTGYTITRGGTPIATLPAGSTSYEDATVVAGSAHTYCATTIAELGPVTSSSVTVCDGGRTVIDATSTELQTFSSPVFPDNNESFGQTLDISGSIAVVGARYQESGNGAVYLLEQDPVTLVWSQTATFYSVNNSTSGFGRAVSASGNTVVVAEDNLVSVLVRNENTGSWTRSQTLTAPAGLSSFGQALAVDGNTLFVSSHGYPTPNLLVYQRNAESSPFTLEQSIDYAPDWDWGPSIVDLDGDVAVTGGFRNNVYRRNASGIWNLETMLVATPAVTGDGLYGTMAVSGDVIFASGSTTDAPENQGSVVWVYHRNPATGQWGTAVASQPGQSDPSYMIRNPETDERDDLGEGFGLSLAVSNGLAAIGARDFGACPTWQLMPCGRLYMYNLNPISGRWEPIFDVGVDGRPKRRQFEPAPDEFDVGFTVAISDDKVMYKVSRNIPESPTPVGAVYISTRPAGNLLAPPSAVAATDGVFQARVQVQWSDEASNEDGYRVLRDGNLVAELAANSESYSDFDIAPGRLSEYCVVTFRNDLVDQPQACDFGWRPPDGAISGSVRAPQATDTPASGVSTTITSAVSMLPPGSPLTADGLSLSTAVTSDLFAEQAFAAAQDSILVCVTPDPDRGLLFDGIGGSVEISRFTKLPGSFTIEFWASRATVENREQVLFVIGDSQSTDNVSARFTATGAFRYTVGGASIDVVESDPLGWHHWAVTQTFNGSRHIIRDGEVVAVDSEPASVAIFGPLVLGSFFGQSAFFGGTLDELRIWDSVLSAERIAQFKDVRLAGNEDNLLGYWSMNQGSGTAIGDETALGRHGRLQDGAYWSANGAIQSCTLVDTQGKYTVGGIRYNESTTFTVTPSQSEHAFDPPASEISLNVQHPVENQVDFIDVTRFAASGVVKFEGTECVVPDVEILVDDVSRASTKRDGRFTASVSPSETTYRFVPRRVSAEDASDFDSFVPSSRNVLVDRPIFDIDFTNTKTRPLNAFFGGSCELVSNLGTMTIEVTTENGCFKREYEVSGMVDIDLPPQKYLVRVTDIQSGDTDLRADMIQYFDDLGVQEIDLTNAADTLDLTYHAPIGMTIAGFPAPSSQCTVYSDSDGGTLPLVPVLQQGGIYNLTLSANEDYGNGRICPIDNGTVTVYDAIADSANTKRTYDIEDGKVIHRTVAASPNVFKGASVNGVSRSFQKSFTASAQVSGRDPFVVTEWVIVEGVRARTAEFVSATTDPFPLLILHDPPGTNSSAFLEKGTTQCTTLSTLQVAGGGAGGSVDLKLGYSPIFGFGVATKTGGGVAVQAKTIIGGSNNQTSGLEVCATTTERFSTSGDVGWSGEDVFMGVALNLVFARADELTVDQCSVDLTERLAADLDPENAFETTFVYGSTHIRDSLIPDLAELIELSGGDPTLEGDPDGDGEIETVRLTQALANWKAQLSNNELLKAQALEGSVKNRSFSAGADYEYSHSVDSTRTGEEAIRFYINGENSFGGILTLGGYDQTFLATATVEYQRVVTTDSSHTTALSTGYTLSDGDTGDFFSVDVGSDPRYGTPVFGTVSGRSSNPWEANTQKRDLPLVSINPPVQHNVPPNEAATFTLNLTNASESGEPREYVLADVKTTNPGSAKLSLNGTPLGGRFLVEAGQTQEITLTVDRGPSRFSYEDLEVIVYPPLDYAIWQADTRQNLAVSDTARFSVYFEAPCSDISILRPRDLWSVNSVTIGDSLEVILRNFDLSGSDIFDVDRIGFQYRRVGTNDWIPARNIAVNKTGSVESDSLDAVVRSWISRWQPQTDGEYDLRAYTECSTGNSVYSDPVRGIVDTKAPKPLGPPQPSDEVLKFGASIMATFDEAVSCASIVTSGDGANTSVSYLDGPLAGTALAGFEATCDGKTVVLDPPSEMDWTPVEGRLLLASLDGVTDVYGNPVAAPIRWQFTVRRSAFAWQPANLNVEIPRGTSMLVDAKLINGRAQPAEFQVPASIVLLPENGSDEIPLAVSTTGGTVVPQGEQSIKFTVPDSLLPGRYTSTFKATRYENDAAMEEIPLYFTADVVCRAPNWTVNPSAFEQSMTLTARLEIDGVRSADPADQIVAMVGTDVRGVASMTEVSPGNYVAQMLIYGNADGDLVQFRVWDNDDCSLYRETSKAFLFKSGNQLGTIGAPIVVEAPPVAVAQAIDLAAGWTWFSTNRIAPDRSVANVLKDIVAAPGDLVKDHEAFAIYDATSGWVGGLTTIENGHGYFVKLQQSNRLLQEGTPTDPTTPIALNNGWTWIGYLPTTALTVDSALESLSPTEGDVIKSQYGFAEYVDGTGWIGSLALLEPGLGYVMYSESGGSLVYPSGNAISRTGTELPDVVVSAAATSNVAPDRSIAASTQVRTESPGVESVSAMPVKYAGSVYEAGTSSSDPSTNSRTETEAESDEAAVVQPWSIDVKDYAATMTLTAEILRDGVVVSDPNVQVGLFVGDEIRGIGQIRYVESEDRHIAFVMGYGDEESAEPFDIRLMDTATGVIESISDPAVAFKPNARVGSIGTPFQLESKTFELPTEFDLAQNYPNPFNSETVIRFALPAESAVQIEVFDVLGRRVAVLVDSDKVEAGSHSVAFDASMLASGMYVYRMKAGEFKSVHKMTLLK